MRKLFATGLAAAVMMTPSASDAVSLAGQEPAQVLLYPYFQAQEDKNSLVQFTNQSDEYGVVAKVIVRENLNGRMTLSFAAYLEPGQTFAASLAEGEEGNPVINFTGDSCTVPSTSDGISTVALRNFLYEGDGGTESFDRAAEGYIEVFETARFNPDSLGGCTAINERWGSVWLEDPSADLLDAGNDLLGQLLWVDVSAGLAREIDVIGLKDFSEGVFADIFSPNDGGFATANSRPTLADVNPAVSEVNLGNSVLTSTWSNNPVDAVSALLMKQRIEGAFFLDDALNAQSELYTFMPTKRFYTDSAISDTAQAPFSELSFSESCDLPSAAQARSRLGDVTPIEAESFCLEQTLNPLDSAALPENGWLRLSFAGEQRVLESDEGDRFVGIPLRAYAWQTFVNGDLGGVRANYATGHQFTGSRDVQPD